MLKQLTAALVLIGLLFLPAFAQDIVRLVPTEPTITADYRNIPFSDILTNITKDAGITVQFAPDVKQEALQKQEINFQMSHAAFEDALTFLLKSVNLTYKVMDAKTIQVITPPSPQ